MPRKALPRNQMRRAVQDRKIEDFIWACLELACVELKQQGQVKTFSGRDLNTFLLHLIRSEKEKKEKGETTEGKGKVVADVNDWLKQVK